MNQSDHVRVAVVIPCFRVTKHILDVLLTIPSFVSHIYVVDDACPDSSGDYVRKHSRDSRVYVLRNSQNMGVGGAVMTGYHAAIKDEMDVIVKMDGDGQMDPVLLASLIEPIITGNADYTKGNRFFDFETVRTMPKIRLLGNAILSFMNKVSSGYWQLFDPTNGYTAIHADVARRLPFKKISRRYFFETDMLFRLNLMRAMVVDVPMEAKYGEEESNLKISNITGEFFVKHVRNFFKRVFYNYYLRDMSLASIELPLGTAFLCYGFIYGCYHWVASAEMGIPTPAGTVMLAALPIFVGIQFLMGFVAYDISSVPVRPIHRGIRRYDMDNKSSLLQK